MVPQKKERALLTLFKTSAINLIMSTAIIGREDERTILQRLLISKQAELLAIYGRRRVGKTYLIRNYYSRNLVF